MCGICGIAYADPNRRASTALIESMARLIDHRGPDGAGRKTLPGAGLGHRRLSIIDIEGGAQPLSNEDGTVWVTYNGEIYNFPELRNLLVARGHRFRTRSDTEVLVHGYEEFGVEIVSRLDGMFAFALYDVPARRLLLARDHFGIKPLFYAVEQGALVFGSTVDTVLAGMQRGLELRRESLQEYLMFRYVAGSYTFDKRVRRLPPAHLLVFERGRETIRQYWEIPPPLREAEQDEESLADALERHLRSAVERQLISDVPVGAFCSGGLDSGLVTALAAQAQPGPMDTFSIGFEESAWDETPLARETATRVGTRHHTVRFGAGDFADHLPAVVRAADEPPSHANSVPLFMLSRYAREHVKVVLTGEGADEVFCGYPRFRILRAVERLQHVPSGPRQLLGGILERLPDHRFRKLGIHLPMSVSEATLHNSRYVRPSTVRALTGYPPSEALQERAALVERLSVPGDAVAGLARYEAMTYLGCALDRMDRMSMAHGLEGRVPFLDVGLVDWAARLPSRVRMSGRRNKRVVRALASRMLGPRVLTAGKSGFGLPLSQWFRTPPIRRLLARVSEPGQPALEHLDRAFLLRIAAEHEGRRDQAEALWLVLAFGLWLESRSDHAHRDSAGRPESVRITV